MYAVIYIEIPLPTDDNMDFVVKIKSVRESKKDALLDMWKFAAESMGYDDPADFRVVDYNEQLTFGDKFGFGDHIFYNYEEWFEMWAVREVKLEK